MKKLLITLFIPLFMLCCCQKVELKTVTDSSQIFKGEIAGMPITMQLYYAGLADCSLYQYFVDGWYYYDKYQKKIPLTGIYDYGKLSLYHFGNKQKQSDKLLKDQITSPQQVEKTAEIAEKLVPKEYIIFEPGDLKGNSIKGNFYFNKKVQSAQLFTGSDMIYRFNNYLTLPDNKKINTFDFINKHGGNQLISYASGENGNRIVLYFEHSSNFNACGRCGASEGEKGYRILYFTKDWNYKNYEEFLTESCLENIYDTVESKSKDRKTLQFKVSKTSSSPAYTFTVDIKNATVVKSK
ncbi:hypothetical protein B0A69_08370 [Chryseobacterium shigense]|uniref:Uncharacterized protein n=1 Tax=Chryseobacterium shigense TaxID=297244 RepID=A0A1N7IFJ6_9FLAO|nr:hypothetical protein [Chryseobacterium shigense]PQA94471.1 hypothetical protein B0A69_08370 [Chryseobacterium shigense]SIS35830.1 hypothetical protein SAMN05421639_103461 [Chryseobacterium shigense]